MRATSHAHAERRLNGQFQRRADLLSPLLASGRVRSRHCQPLAFRHLFAACHRIFYIKNGIVVTIHLWVLAECAAIRMKQSGRGLLALQTSNNGGNRLCFPERGAGRLLNVPRAPISHYEMPLGFYGCHKSD